MSHRILVGRGGPSQRARGFTIEVAETLAKYDDRDALARAADHPVVHGIDSFRITPSSTTATPIPPCRCSPPRHSPGDHGEPETAGIVMPVVWLRRLGQGRVSSRRSGTRPADLAVPSVHTITERGLRWAAGADVVGHGIG